MSARELLELAAKAAGFNFYWSVEEPSMIERFGRFVGSDAFGGMLVKWNPLNNDGDAFRLAVKLKMVLDTDYNGGSVAGNCNVECNYDAPEFGYQEGNGKKDPYAATRRAIVRAAAEIGRAMP